MSSRLILLCLLLGIGAVQGVYDHYTRYGKRCAGLCDKENENYYGCYDTDNSYEYCSLYPDTTYYGTPCRADHPCGTHGYGYYWCYTDSSNNWNYCGPIIENNQNYRQYARCGRQCVSPCTRSGDYYSCRYNDNGSSNYCSPSPRTTIHKDERCRSGHECGFHGKTYTWCYTDYHNNWEYCGVVKTCGYEDAALSNSRVKRDVLEHVIITEDTYDRSDSEDSQNALVLDRPKRTPPVCRVPISTRTTIVWDEESSNLATPNRNQRDEASRLIRECFGQSESQLSQRNAGTIRMGQYVRIDVQGQAVIHGVRHLNLQIQINGPRRPGQSTSIALVLIPVDQDFQTGRFIRRAFVMSMENGTQVTMRRETQ